MEEQARKLYRSDEKMLGGVCAGIADYFGVELNIVRVVCILLVIATFGVGFLVYVGLWLFLPVGRGDYDEYIDVAPVVEKQLHVGPKPPEGLGLEIPQLDEPEYVFEQPQRAARREPKPGNPRADRFNARVEQLKKGSDELEWGTGAARTSIIIGLVLIVLGAVVLLDRYVVHLEIWRFWPFIIMIVAFCMAFIPDDTGITFERVLLGVFLFAVGVAFLFLSFGLIPSNVFWLAIRSLWPALIISAGFLVLQAALGKRVCAVIATVFIIVALFVSLWYYTRQMGFVPITPEQFMFRNPDFMRGFMGLGFFG